MIDDTVEDVLQDVEAFLLGISDDNLVYFANECAKDLELASKEQNNSEWHEACFAAFILFSQEIGKRGLKITDKGL